MLFDEKYSETVSLSKIMDCFITEGEKPSVIVNFLKQYSNSEVFEILSNSFCSPRILSINFLHKCSIFEKFFFFDLLKDIRNIRNDYSLMRIFQYFMWQILRGDFSEMEKRKVRTSMETLDRMLREDFLNTSHPYKGHSRKEMSEYDNILYKHVDDENFIIEMLLAIDIFDFNKYIENAEKSLWFPRIMQIDVFENLDIQRQYVFINNIFSHYGIIYFRTLIYRFARQIFCSDVDVLVKNMVFEKLNSSVKFPEDDDKEWFKMIKESSCYEELIMNMTLYGLDNVAEETIMYFIIQGDKDMLRKMYENNKEILDEYLNITDLIEYWNENEKKQS